MVEPNVFKTLFNKQEVKAALFAGVRILHLHDRTQEAIRDTRLDRCVCRCDTWWRLKCCW